jgi:hypothetical protein
MPSSILQDIQPKNVADTQCIEKNLLAYPRRFRATLPFRSAIAT